MDTTPLLTLAEACDFLNVRPGNNDDRVRHLIVGATEAIEIATGRSFARQQFTEYLTTRDNQRSDYDFRGSSDYNMPSVDVGGMRTVVSPQSFPLTGVALDPATVSVWYAPYARSLDDYNADAKLGDRAFIVDDDRDVARLHLYAATRFHPRALKVEYIAGYAAAPSENDVDEITLSASIPGWLRTAALIQLQFMNIKLRSDNIGMSSERTVSEKGKVAVSQFLKVNGLTPEAISFVAHLRRPRTGRG